MSLLTAVCAVRVVVARLWLLLHLVAERIVRLLLLLRARILLHHLLPITPVLIVVLRHLRWLALETSRYRCILHLLLVELLLVEL